ncbi:MAG: hypothetical protein EHM47_17975, partial [Ignavibacteriales bacterium]
MVIYKFSLVILVLLFLSINAVSTYAQTQVLRKGNAVHYFLEMNEGENILTLDTAAINGNLYYKRKSSFPWFYPNSSGSISYERISGDSAFYILTWQNTDSLVFNFNWKVGTAIYSDTSGDIISERKITKVQVEQYLLPQDTIYYISQYNFNTVTGDTTYWMPEMVRYSKKLGEIERGLWSILIGAKIDGIRYGYVAPYPEEVNFSVDSLYLAEAYDTLNYYLINSSDYDILIDSLFDNNYFGYLTFFIKGDDYFFINFAGRYPNHPLDTLKYPVAAHDSV